jgi:hypothetical protein
MGMTGGREGVMGQITKGEDKKAVVRRARAVDKRGNLWIYTRPD